MSKRHQVPCWVVWLLRLFVGDAEVCEAWIGDLEEDCTEALGSGVSSARRRAWFVAAAFPLAFSFLFRNRLKWRKGVMGVSKGRGPGRESRMESLRRDGVHTFRRLLRTPSSTALIVAILGIGIGGTTALFSVVESVLLNPLPFDQPDRLVGVWLTSPGNGIEWLNQSPASYFTIRDESREFEEIAIWDPDDVTVTQRGAGAERVVGMRVTDGIFDVLRIRPLLGRPFQVEDDQPHSPPVFILGHGYWQRRCGGDPGVVGRAVTVDGVVGDIIGVMPPDTRIQWHNPDIYVPLRWDRSRVTLSNFSYQAMARLADGVSLERARAGLAGIIPRTVERHPGGMTLQQARALGLAVRIRPLREELVEPVGNMLWFLFGAVILVLVIACANVANLVLLRSEGRHREVAIRAALGAGRAGLFRSLLLESVGLGLLGGLLGAGLAFVGVDVRSQCAVRDLPGFASCPGRSDGRTSRVQPLRQRRPRAGAGTQRFGRVAGGLGRGAHGWIGLDGPEFPGAQCGADGISRW